MRPRLVSAFTLIVGLWAFFTLFYVDIVLSIISAAAAMRIRKTKLSYLFFVLSVMLLAVCVFRLVIRTMQLGHLPGIIA